jgi:hypothetical protein
MNALVVLSAWENLGREIESGRGIMVVHTYVD